jgi:hypothetical protein
MRMATLAYGCNLFSCITKVRVIHFVRAYLEDVFDGPRMKY